jgi:hypothetical protein
MQIPNLTFPASGRLLGALRIRVGPHPIHEQADLLLIGAIVADMPKDKPLERGDAAKRPPGVGCTMVHDARWFDAGEKVLWDLPVLAVLQIPWKARFDDR